MKPFIGIQAGHQNIESNCAFALRGGTGAPGEKDNNIRIRDRLGQILISKGFQVQLDDANANCQKNTIGKDFDFYIALHCEANTHGKGGGFLAAPDPAFDSVNIESKRIVKAIKDEYFKNTGIEEHEEWITTAMTQYYMWSSLTAKTPCGIIEMGVAQDAHDKVILADTDRVANAIARGICKAFNIPFDAPQSPQEDPRDRRIKELEKEVEDLKKQIVELQKRPVSCPPAADPRKEQALIDIQHIINNL